MTREIFYQQIDRLKIRFGAKHFDTEFVRLACEKVLSMSDARFIWQVNTWIGSKRPSDPPMLAEFEEARLAEEKLKLKNDAIVAARAFEARKVKPLRDLLKPHFGYVESVGEAVEIARLNLIRKRDDDPGGAA